MDNRYEILEEFMTQIRSLSQNTRDTYGIALRAFLAYCDKPLVEITRKDIEAWENSLFDDGWIASTVHVKLAALRKFFSYVKDRRFITINPMIGYEWPKIKKKYKKPLEKRELFLLTEAALNNVRDRAIIATMYNTGVRVSELINIEIGHIIWEERKIVIPEGKGLNPRRVRFTFECGERIREYLQTRDDDNPYLFLTKYKKPFSRQGIWKMLKKYGLELDIAEKLTPHTLRRNFATQLSDRNMKYQNIAKLLGIVNLDVVRHYVDTSEKKILNEFRDKN